jgi:hypothetical protein
MSTIYTFQDMKRSCRSLDEHKVGAQSVPVCKHPENQAADKLWGYCDENVCPIVRKILDEGDEWE